MSSNSYISESLASIAQSSSLIRSLTFHQTQVFTLAVLSPEAWFETHLIRDAEPHEVSLFRPSDNRYDPIHAQEEEKWVATKRKGPERLGALEKASPLKEGSAGRKAGGGAADDPERCILAAQRLLEIYPMPRAKEHVDALMAQVDGIKSSIADLEDQIKRPLPKPVVNTAQEDNAKRASEIADAIRREEMEIFALEQIMVEQELERKSVVKVQVVKPTPSTSSGSNPFAKSNVLDRKVLNQTTPPTSPLTSPRRTSSSFASPQVRTPKPSRESPAPSPEKIRTPIKTKPISTTPTPVKADEVTPRAQRIANRSVASSNVVTGKRNNGVSDADLEMVAAKVWTGMGDTLRPWARKTLIRDGEEIPSPLKELSFKATLNTLATILSSPSDLNLPVSPGGSIASTFHSLGTTTTGAGGEDEESDPSPPQPANLLEFELLNLLLSTLSSTTPIPSSVPRPSTSTTLPPLGITFRDAILVSSLVSPSSPSSPNRVPINSKKQDPMVSMNALKSHLGVYASERGWEEVGSAAAMGTTAIYGLVSKAVLRIDRRGKEGPMLGFRN